MASHNESMQSATVYLALSPWRGKLKLKAPFLWATLGQRTWKTKLPLKRFNFPHILHETKEQFDCPVRLSNKKQDWSKPNIYFPRKTNHAQYTIHALYQILSFSPLPHLSVPSSVYCCSVNLVVLFQSLGVSQQPGGLSAQLHEVHRFPVAASLPLHYYILPSRDAALWGQI